MVHVANVCPESHWYLEPVVALSDITAAPQRARIVLRWHPASNWTVDDPARRSYLFHLAEELVKSLLRSVRTDEVTIISSSVLPSVDQPHLSMTGDTDDLSSLEVRLRSSWAQYIGVMQSWPSNTDVDKLSERVAKRTLNFISFKEYMEEYDWEGEFTEEEARSWMPEAAIMDE